MKDREGQKASKALFFLVFSLNSRERLRDGKKKRRRTRLLLLLLDSGLLLLDGLGDVAAAGQT